MPAALLKQRWDVGRTHVVDLVANGLAQCMRDDENNQCTV